MTAIGDAGPARAYDINEYLSLSGVVAGAVQCLEQPRHSGAKDTCRGGLVVQPEVSLRPTEVDELFAKLGFAAGNALNPASPFILSSWAADLEDDVEDINGRGRSHILTAWYKHIFELGEARSLGLTAGIIDATDYLDDNAHANDEFTQFMNEVFVNAPTAFLPSYDYGGVVELENQDWSFRAVVMTIGENDDGRSYTFLGGQIARSVQSHLGAGTYRIVVTGTNERFSDAAGAGENSLFGVIFNADQELGEGLGGFVRIGWQNSDAAVDYDLLLSGGLGIGGERWGRPDDNIGLAIAYLSGGNGDVSQTHVAEAYYRLMVRQHFALTGDVQYISDRLKAGRGPDGFVVGLRGAAEF